MKKNKLPFIRWYASDFLAGTRGMKSSEVGIYTILLNLMYEQCNPLDLDMDYLASQCGCRKASFKKALEKLKSRGKIIIKDGGLWNERVQKEFTFRAKKSSIATDNVNKRWKKDNEINGNSIQAYNNGNTDVILNQKPEARNHKEKNIYTKRFEDWYALYPIKKSKLAASRLYEKAIKDGVCEEKLSNAVKVFASSVKGKDEKYIAHPSTWLNQGRWDDEIKKTKKSWMM